MSTHEVHAKSSATWREIAVDDATATPPHNRKKRWWRRVLAIAVVVGIVGAGTRLFADGKEGDGSAADDVPTATAVVQRRDLVEQDSFDGTLGYDGTATLTNQLSGTITGLRAQGAIVTRGEWLYEVDERPVPLLYGSKPMWRTLSLGVNDGDDVRQLERNLVAMGYDPDRDIEIDRHFDDATSDAIQRWEDDLGIEKDGTIELGEIAFLPGAVRIGTLQTSVGSTAGPGTPIADVSSTTRIVTVKVEVERRSLFERGRRVEIELPNGKTVRGVVETVGKVADSTGDGSPTVDVTISLSGGKGLGGLDATPVDVNVTTRVEKDALTVPVAALLALAEGGYAVEVQDADRTKLVAVDIGTFANGYVEISGDGLRQGMKVVIPE